MEDKVRVDKPRVRFCWNCGAKLNGNHHKEIEVASVKRIVHKACSNPDRECEDEEPCKERI